MVFLYDTITILLYILYITIQYYYNKKLFRAFGNRLNFAIMPKFLQKFGRVDFDGIYIDLCFIIYYKG